MHLHLNTFGAFLHVRDAMFEIRKRQEDGSWAGGQPIAAKKLQSIWLGTGTSLSSEAVALALKNNVDIVFLESNGQPLGRVWHSKLGSTTRIRKCQLEASLDARGLSFTKKWLSEKLGNQVDFVRDLKKHRPQHHDFLSQKIEKIETMRAAIAALDAPVLDAATAGTLHGLEGTAGRLYFETLSFVLPPNWQFAGRSSRPAADFFNCFLNYAYGVLYSRVEKGLMLAGLDPFVGFLHRDDFNHRSMVYDFIEPFRAWADKVVFTLFSGKKVNQSHADAVAGGFSLNPEGKKLLLEPLNEYLENDIIRYKNRNRTRATILQLEAHAFAQELLGGAAAGAVDFEVELV